MITPLDLRIKLAEQAKLRSLCQHELTMRRLTSRRVNPVLKDYSDLELNRIQKG